MLELGVKTLIAYLLGSLVGSLLLGRLSGVDIRDAGQRQRRRHQRAAHAGLVVRARRRRDRRRQGAAGGRLCCPASTCRGSASTRRSTATGCAVACAIAVVVGHVYPVWYEFRGGKGAATLLGAVAVLAPAALCRSSSVWLGCRRCSPASSASARCSARRRCPRTSRLASPGDLPLLVFGVVMARFRRVHAPREHRADARWQRESRATPVVAAAAMRTRSRAALLALLADGELHSGRALAMRLGVSRAAVWKLVAELRERRRRRRQRRASWLPAAAGRANCSKRAGCVPQRLRTGDALPGELEVLFSRWTPPTITCYSGRTPSEPAIRASCLPRLQTRRTRPPRPCLARAVRIRASRSRSAGRIRRLPADLSALSLAMGVRSLTRCATWAQRRRAQVAQ